jgi:hypothetical protein
LWFWLWCTAKNAQRSAKKYARCSETGGHHLLRISGVLIMYKPNFCAECGTKVLRLRWHFWTSRKFCNACARRFRTARVTRPVLIGLALIISGYVAGRTRRPSPPPLTIERRADSPLSDVPVSRTAILPPASAQSSGLSAGTQNSASTVEEDVYLCGARTKKGTPCSRRVQAPRRCWQHKGMPAMLPQEKLLVKG